MRIYSLCLVIISVLFVACSKNDPSPSPVPATLLSKAYVYFDDTSGVARYVDSIEYNEKNQITKIDVYSQGKDSVTYTFAYNSDDNITEMHIKNIQFPNTNYDYFFIYNAAKKIDSIKHMGAYESFYSVLTYNTSKQIDEVKTYYTSGADTVLYYHCTYYRSTQLDSVISDNLPINERSRLIMGASTIDPKPVLAINKAYILMWAARSDFRTLFKSDIFDPSLFTHQFVNPDELLLKNCTRSYYDIGATYQPLVMSFTNTFSLNTEGMPRLYTNLYSNGSLNSYMYVRFSYLTK